MLSALYKKNKGMDKQVVCGETANTITSRKVINLGTKRGKGSSNLSSKKYSNVNYQVGIYYRKSSAKKDDISIHERQDEKKLRDKKSNQKFTAKLAKICVL